MTGAGRGDHADFIAAAATCGEGRHAAAGLGSAVLPLPAGASVLLDRDRQDTGTHALPVEDAAEVVEFVGDEAGHAVGESGQPGAAVEVVVRDNDAESPGNASADVEETEAALELLVLVGGGLLDRGVEQHERVGGRIRGDDHCGGAVEAELGGGNSHSLAERVQFPDPADGAEEFTDDAFGLLCFSWQVERARWGGEDGSAFLDDADVRYGLARGEGAHRCVLFRVGSRLETPLQAVPGMQGWIHRRPAEDGPVSSPGALGLGPQWREVHTHGRLGSPDSRVGRGGEGEFHGKATRRQPDGSLEPWAPFVSAHAVGVDDLRFLARIEGKAAHEALELQPEFLDGGRAFGFSQVEVAAGLVGTEDTAGPIAAERQQPPPLAELVAAGCVAQVIRAPGSRESDASVRRSRGDLVENVQPFEGREDLFAIWRYLMIRDNTGVAGGRSAGCSGQARLKPSSGGYQKMSPQSGRGTPYETPARGSATDRHEESAAPRRPFDAMQAAPTLGVLGGMGPAATAHFMKQLAASVEATTDQGHPKTMLLSDPSIPDRTQAILRGTYEPLAPIRDGLLTLCGWGADLLAVPCNSAHYFIDLVSDTIPAKIIDIVEATLDRASAANPEGAWLAATDGTVLGRMYQRRAAMMDYRLLLPPDNLQKVIQEAVHAVKGKDLETSATLIMEATRKLWILEDIIIIQGCTEIPIAYDMAGLPPNRSISSVDALASACINELNAFYSTSEDLQIRPAIEKRSEPDSQIQEQNL